MSKTAVEEAGEIQKTILLVAADGGPASGRQRLQMMVYVMLSGESAEVIASYRPGPDGPHSDMADGEVDRLVRAGIISEDGPIALTPAGEEAAAGLAEGVGRWDLVAFKSCKRIFAGLSADEALAYIYWAHPGIREPGSYGRLEPDIERHVLSMLEKEKISPGRGAMMLGIGRFEMWKRMDEYGIPMQGVEDEDTWRTGIVCHAVGALPG